MTLDQAVRIVQVSYPQVYLACHTRHQRKRTTEHRLSARDASILAHLREDVATVPARLAAHLGIGRPTLSEALKRLDALGFVHRDGAADPGGDRPARTTGVRLSRKGAAAIRDTSVLETPRLRAVLEMTTSRELERIAGGLAALAEACRRHAERRPARRGARA